MAIKHVQSVVVHTWRCMTCKYEWDVYGGDPYDYDSDEAPQGRVPVICPHCMTDAKIDRGWPPPSLPDKR